MKSVNALHRLIFKWFKPQMVQLAYDPKPQGVPMEYVFHDSDGRRWYECKPVPILRQLLIMECIVKIYRGVDDQELTEGLAAIEKAITEQKGGKMRPNIAMIGHICKTLTSRRGYAIQIDAVYELAALYYIIEGESPENPDRGNMPGKIEALKNCETFTIEGLFFSQSLDKLFPFLENFEGTMMEAAQVAKIEAEVFANHLKQYNNG